MSKKGYGSNKVRISGLTEKLIIAGLILCCVIAVFFSAFVVVKSFGKNSLKKHATQVANTELSTQLNDTEVLEQEEPLELQEGQILVDGQVYEYNKEIMTFLCMGVDSRAGISKEKTPGKAGQADAILMIVVNPKAEKIDVIAINRDTMTNIEIYDEAGVYLGEEKKQLALQYAYGDGREKSCVLMEEKISDLFYGIPIHGYGALDMQSIATLNDAVGGVEVTILEDMTKYRSQWQEGAKILLKGEDSLLYIREREEESGELGTNIARIERQKQYLLAYVEKLKSKIKEDITFPLTLYGKVDQHIVTSLKLDEITYLAGTLTDYDFKVENIRGIAGESAMGEKNEEFYPDEEKLKNLVIEIFYDKVESKDIK
ncbi:MAG: LCP family protein [Lachnospiraceae bacterium]|nr:LCP family protein [Lachnospiraceae bacterium]